MGCGGVVRSCDWEAHTRATGGACRLLTRADRGVSDVEAELRPGVRGSPQTCIYAGQTCVSCWLVGVYCHRSTSPCAIFVPQAGPVTQLPRPPDHQPALGRCPVGQGSSLVDRDSDVNAPLTHRAVTGQSLVRGTGFPRLDPTCASRRRGLRWFRRGRRASAARSRVATAEPALLKPVKESRNRQGLTWLKTDGHR